MRYLITFSYDGSYFYGFQRQKELKSVQKTLEDCLSKLLNEDIVIKGSGRTDAGVHALMQIAHFDTPNKIGKSFLTKLNDILNGEINVYDIKEVSSDFHARFSVKAKTYRYLINTDKNKVNNKYFYTSYNQLDINKMTSASKIFLGVHDFRNFVSGKRDDYTTCIFDIKIEQKENIISLEFTGTGFYRYMIRHLVGALYDIGRGKINEDVIEDMLYNPQIEKSLSVVPAYGLYLVNIEY